MSREGRNFVVTVSMKETTKQKYRPVGWCIVMKLIEIMPDSSQKLLELFDNQGKDIHYHDEEPDNHDSRIFISDRFSNTTDLLNFFQERIRTHIR